VEEHLYKGRIVQELQAPARELTGKIAWLSNRKGTLPAEQRIVLERAGLIDPTSIEDYIIRDGYIALGKVVAEKTPAEESLNSKDPACVDAEGLASRLAPSGNSSPILPIPSNM